VYREGQLNLLPPDQSKNWILNASIDYLGSALTDAALAYVLKDSNNDIVLSGQLSNITSDSSTMTGSIVIPSEQVQLWWPIGLGPQTLYNLTIDIVGSGDTTLASVTKRMGFRTIVLNETPITEEQVSQGIAPGNNWHFEVNGHEFYAKGSSKTCSI
jgi:beta-mannosidase